MEMFIQHWSFVSCSLAVIPNTSVCVLILIWAALLLGERKAHTSQPWTTYIGAYRLVYYDHVTIVRKHKDGCLRRQAISREDSESLVSDLS